MIEFFLPIVIYYLVKKKKGHIYEKTTNVKQSARLQWQTKFDMYEITDKDWLF